jgi:malonyl-CoA/methylmalonyl-CoA synthetase
MRIGYVIFTSGSTGPPKAVLHYYKAFVPLLLETIHKFQISTSDVGILHMPGHWMRGISGQIMFLLSGCRLEYAYGIWTPKWMWQQVLTGRVTCMLNGASDYRKLTDYYESHLRHLPPAQLVPYTVGLRSLRLPCIGGTPLAKSIWDAWNSIDGSQPLINDYGSTETFNLMTTFPADRSLPTVSIVVSFV